MPYRLLTLVLCLLVLPPQPLCACRLVGGHGTPASDHPVAKLTTTPGCPCCCHTDPDGDPADCPHAATVAIADSPKPPTVGDLSDAPPTFLPFFVPRITRSPLLGHPPSPPGAGHVPLYLILCDLRN